MVVVWMGHLALLRRDRLVSCTGFKARIINVGTPGCLPSFPGIVAPISSVFGAAHKLGGQVPLGRPSILGNSFGGADLSVPPFPASSIVRRSAFSGDI